MHSVCHHSSALDISKMSLLCILHQELNIHPYKLQIVQALNDMKSKVYVDPLESIASLQQNIHKEILKNSN